MTGRPWILGISASHNGAACLMRGDELVVAVQEERLSRIKRARVNAGEAFLAIPYCLRAAGIGVRDLDAVVTGAQAGNALPHNDVRANPMLAGLRSDAVVIEVSHHLAHAYHAHYSSGFAESAVLVIDGMGSPVADLDDDERGLVSEHGNPDDHEIVSAYRCDGAVMKTVWKQTVRGHDWLVRRRPGMSTFGSLGGMYSAVAEQIFGETMEAGKVMGLAPYGRPTFEPTDFLDADGLRLAFHDHVPAHFDSAERWPRRREEYEGLAAAVQNALEYALHRMFPALADLTGERHICYTGGTALNSVVNEQLHAARYFQSLHVPAAAEDSGPAIGAAVYGATVLGARTAPRPLGPDAMGCRYPRAALDTAVAQVPGVAVRGPADAAAVVDRLIGGAVVGWFEGRGELGPRALGHRSILGDPRRPDLKDELNARIKHRESFRPFAPIALLSEADSWFITASGTPPDSPYMLRVVDVRSELRPQVPAIVHVDGTARLQTVDASDGPIFDLLTEFFRRTGVPMLLNTSLNVAGEPIAETPRDALLTMHLGQMDSCWVDGVLVERAADLAELADRVVRCAADRRTDGGLPTYVVRTPWGDLRREVSEEDAALLEAAGDASAVRDLGPPGEQLVRRVLRLCRLSLLEFQPSGTHADRTENEGN